MSIPSWIQAVFAAVDRSDPAGFVSHLSPKARFVFGNAPPIEGTAAIGAMLVQFFASIHHTRHELREGWTSGDTVIVSGIVTYTRLDGSTYTVPFANVFKVEGEKIRDYQIYVDNHELYRAA